MTSWCCTRRLSRQQVWELTLCILVFALGKLVPLVWDAFDTSRSIIPYQTAVAGDVLLELDLAYEQVQHETIPDVLAVIFCIVIPLCIFVIVGCYWKQQSTEYTMSDDMHAILCVYYLAVGMTCS